MFDEDSLNLFLYGKPPKGDGNRLPSVNVHQQLFKKDEPDVNTKAPTNSPIKPSIANLTD